MKIGAPNFRRDLTKATLPLWYVQTLVVKHSQMQNDEKTILHTEKPYIYHFRYQINAICTPTAVDNDTIQWIYPFTNDVGPHYLYHETPSYHSTYPTSLFCGRFSKFIVWYTNR